MRNSVRLQMIAVLAIGGLLGYAAASAKLDVFSAGNAAPPATPVADKAAELYVSFRRIDQQVSS